MVCKIFEILDENEIKKLPKVDYKMTKHNYAILCKLKADEWQYKSEFDEIICDMVSEKKRNENYKKAPPRIQYAIKKLDKLYTDMAEWNASNQSKWRLSTDQINQRFFKWADGEQNVYDYLDIIPFTPSVMINISPDWKDKRCNGTKVKMLKHIIDEYMQEEWYDKWEYVIENGSDGTHIHAHIVAHMNVKRLKSTESHLRKGNHTQQLKKYANKLKGMEGTIKGTSVQKTFLRNEELVKDKLLYLHEEHKPEGHKNKSVIDGGFVTGCL